MVMEGFPMILGVALHRASDQKFSKVGKGDAFEKKGGASVKREKLKK